MGNSCSESYNNKALQHSYEIHIQDFKRTYKSLRFPKNLAFIHDPKTFRICLRSNLEPRILKRITFANLKELCQFINDMERFAVLEHDNLIKIYNYSVEKNQLKDFVVSYTLNVVLEHFEHTLYDELGFRTNSNRPFGEKAVRKVLDGLVDALEFLQMKNIHHGNLKPSTVYIGSNHKPKVMLTGKPSITESTRPHSQESIAYNYTAPKVKGQIVESASERESVGSQNTNRESNAYKADVFSLGLIILEMMSMKSVVGLNKSNQETARQYKINECDSFYTASLRNIVEAMLKDDESSRPDFIDLKQLILMEEYIGFVSVKGISIRKSDDKKSDDAKNLVELKTIKNNSEFEFKFSFSKDLTEMSDVTDMSLLTDNNTEEKKFSNGNISNTLTGSEDLGYDLSPIRGVIGVKHDTIPELKITQQQDNAFIKALEEEKEGETKLFELEEMLIESEKDISAAKDYKLKKLVVNSNEKPYSNETCIMLRDLLVNQALLNDLILALPKSKLGNEGLSLICDGIEKNSELCLCYIDFRKNRILDNGLKKLGRCLSNKPNMMQLGINLSDNQITRKGCIEIESWFEALRSLKSLAINLGGNKIGSDGITLIGNGIVKLEQMESLVLMLYTNEIEGPQGILSLFQGLNRIHTLKRLKIDLSSNLLEDDDLAVMVEFIKRSVIDEVVIELKDNCISEEARSRIINSIKDRVNILIKF